MTRRADARSAARQRLAPSSSVAGAATRQPDRNPAAGERGSALDRARRSVDGRRVEPRRRRETAAPPPRSSTAQRRFVGGDRRWPGAAASVGRRLGRRRRASGERDRHGEPRRAAGHGRNARHTTARRERRRRADAPKSPPPSISRSRRAKPAEPEVVRETRAGRQRTRGGSGSISHGCTASTAGTPARFSRSIARSTRRGELMRSPQPQPMRHHLPESIGDERRHFENRPGRASACTCG